MRGKGVMWQPPSGVRLSAAGHAPGHYRLALSHSTPTSIVDIELRRAN